MRGGEIIVKTLANLDSKFIFGLPGVHTLEIYRALYDEKSIRHILMKNEVNAGVAADVYGRLTGEPGIVITIAGPGATHCVTSLAQSYSAASPLIHISSDVPTYAYREALHGVDFEDFLVRVFKPVTKWATRVKCTDDIVPTLVKSYEVATRERMGPVHVSVPIDVMQSEGKSFAKYAPRPRKWRCVGEIDEESISKLLKTKRLVIYAGKNVSRYGCEEKLLELCELLNAPLVVHGRREGDDVVVPYDHPLYAGFVGGLSHPAALHALKSSDLILSIGIRLGSVEEIPLKFGQSGCIHVDVEPAENLIYSNSISKTIVGSLKETLTALINRLKSFPAREPDKHFLQEISMIKNQISEKIEAEIEDHMKNTPLHPGVVVKILRSVLDRDSIITVDVGQSAFWVRDSYKALCVRGLLSVGGYASMGFSIPAAIATKLVYPEKKVFSVVGDGGLLMSYSDLPTLVENNLGVIIVVFNDSKYGQVWQLENTLLGGRFIASNLQTADFATIFKAFGGKGISVRTFDQAKEALEEAKSSEKPTLIDIKTDFRYTPPGWHFYVHDADSSIGKIKYPAKGIRFV